MSNTEKLKAQNNLFPERNIHLHTNNSFFLFLIISIISRFYCTIPSYLGEHEILQPDDLLELGCHGVDHLTLPVAPQVRGPLQVRATHVFKHHDRVFLPSSPVE